MTIVQDIQNAVVIASPVAIYVSIAHWRWRLSWREIAYRLGLRLGDGRSYLYALIAAVLAGVMCVSVAAWTSSFKGSMIAPFVGVAPTAAILSQILSYGFLATGIPEELIFRGLIAGALFRRMSYWKANGLQAVIFMLPHLLLLFIAPRLWPLALCLPLALGLVAGWLRQRSGSIGPSVLVHAISNAAGALSVLAWTR